MNDSITVGDKVEWTRGPDRQPFTGTVLYILGDYARVDVGIGLPGWTTLSKLTRIDAAASPLRRAVDGDDLDMVTRIGDMGGTEG